MKSYLTRLYLWVHGLLAEFISGAADAFLYVGGGATVAQTIAPTLPALPRHDLVLMLAFAGARRAAAFLKANPLPALPSDDRRADAATAALQGLLSDPTPRPDSKKPGETCAQAVARIAVEHADALTSQLSKP